MARRASLWNPGNDARTCSGSDRVSCACISVALAITETPRLLLEAGLSFLGMGVPSPAPSWGNMIADGWPKMAVAPWCSTVPGLAISLVVMALNAVADALRDALDPRKETA